MTDSPSIISTKSEFLLQFSTLKKGDIVCTRLPLQLGEEHILLDLVHRQVILIPSALSQMASKSKCFQARIFSSWMIPDTTVIYSAHQLLENINIFQRKNISQVIVKKDKKNAGLGILLYRSIEEVYTHAANDILEFPFVLQPYISDCEDIRVVILGDYIEAYKRVNPDNFRNNLHCGGSATPYTLPDAAVHFCREVMTRGDFPYAHLDLMLRPDGGFYLAEINLRGGIQGAKITTQEYKKRKEDIEKQLLAAQKKFQST